MKWILVAILAALLAVTQGRPADNVFEWKTASLSSWPQAQPFFPPSAAIVSSPITGKDGSQLRSANDKIINTVGTQPIPWTAYSSLFFNPYPYSYLYSPRLLPSIPTEYQAPEVKTVKSTIRPANRFPEPTTKVPTIKTGRKAPKNDKIVDNEKSGSLDTDSRLISAVQEINPMFVIENIIPIPGTRFLQLSSVEKFPKKSELTKPKKPANANPKQLTAAPIKVEAMGNTAAGGAVPNISFGSYFIPYNSNIQNDDKKIASLILQPSSKAVVGNGGTAISAPISRAVLKKGVPTNVFFGPESVAIAGVGGKAHAQADLILDLEEKRSVNRNSDVVSFPYYGGLKGHSLNIQHKDGRVNRVVVIKPQTAEGRSNFDNHFNKIQEAAARLVAIQEIAKQKGTFSQEDNKFYADSLYELGVAAQSLAQLQQNGEIKDFSKLLQGSNTQIKPQPGNNTPAKPAADVPNQSEDTLMPVNQDDPYEDLSDSVAVNAPKKDASVAEAKPVGLSIAGEGGVASSKPNAVAIAGREGLAVASPKATAIAGVSPEEAAAYSINVPSRNQIIIKNRGQQDNVSSVKDEIKASLKNIIINRSTDEAKSVIAGERDNYDIVEGEVPPQSLANPIATLRVNPHAKRMAHKVNAEVNKDTEVAIAESHDPYVLVL